MFKQTIVLSGINLFEGGPLSVYKDFINAIIAEGRNNKYSLVLFVHRKELFREYEQVAEIIELPKSRKSYIFRIYYEYVYFYKYSKKRNIDYWISMHDITPNVKAKYLYTYCHQPTPFYKPSRIDWKFAKKICLFAMFYRYLYGINIKKNNAVIVQQNWIREEFKRQYKIDEVIVARPNIIINFPTENRKDIVHKTYTFVYAAFPRTFKNFEIICEACKYLEQTDFAKKYKVILTINGTENKYSNYIWKKYNYIDNIEWIGIQNRERLFNIYRESDCLIFPSKLETWGLPISEYKCTGNPIIMADLPYAHETIGDYSKTCFFNPNSGQDLAKKMIGAIEHDLFQRSTALCYDQPYANDWGELIKIIFGE